MCALGLAVAAGACDKPPVVWTDPVEAKEPAGAAPVVPTSVPAGANRCPGSPVTARRLTKTFAVWWSVRPDSSAALVVASSPDSGRTWGNPLAVDTTDVSSAGCNRPLPAVTAVGDDVYVAYSMIAPEGKGVFFAHSMGSMLHSPVPVIYGERLVATAIAADDQRVVVAYEEPNGRHAQIDIAVSATQGHIFEIHTTASRDVDDAVLPAVTLDGNEIRVSWLSRSASGASARVVRAGRLQ